MKLDQFVDEVFATVTGMVERALAPVGPAIEKLRAEIKAIPAGKDGKDGRDGKDADPALIARLVSEAVAALPVPKDGKDAEPEVMRAMVLEAVTAAVAALPKPRDGVDGKSIEPAQVREMVDAAVGALPKPRDGKDGRDAVIDEQALRAAVDKAVAAIPLPKDGKDADPAQLEAIRQAMGGLAQITLIDDMADEFTRGLSGYAAFDKTPEEVLRELAASVQGLERALREPVMPIIDGDGNIIGVRRGAAA